MIGVLEFLRRCVGHRVTGWLESWSSYGGMLDTASLDDWESWSSYGGMLDTPSLDDWSLGVLMEVCWTPCHWMTGVLEFLQRCA